MKFLMIVNDYEFALSHRSEILNELRINGYDVHIACANEVIEKQKYPEISFHKFSNKITGQGIFTLIKSFFLIFHIINKIKPNIVHLLTIKPILLGGLIMLTKTKIPTVMSIPGFGSIFSEKSLIGKIKIKLIKFFYWVVFRNSNKHIIVQSKSNKEEVLKISKSKDITLIKGSGVDLYKFNYFPLPKEKQSVLFASRLLKKKGILDFVEAAKLINKSNKNIIFKVAGKYDSTNPDSISQIDYELLQNLNYIKFLGNLSDIREELIDSSLMVLPTYYGEGLPKVLIESNAIGRPVITTEISGCGDFVIQNKNGLIVEKKNPKQLAITISTLLSNQKKLEEMSIFSAEYAKNFNVKDVAKKHIDIYEKLLKSQNRI